MDSFIDGCVAVAVAVAETVAVAAAETVAAAVAVAEINPSTINPSAIWDHFGIILESFWNHFGMILG